MYPDTGSAGSSSNGASSRRIEVLEKQLDRALGSLAEAKAFARSVYQTEVFQTAEALMGSGLAGLEVLYQRADQFDTLGVFEGGPWVDPGKLQPPLVSGSLRGSGVYPVVETLSELRMLALATDRASNEQISAEEATEFLNETMALNLDLLFPGDTEVERMEGGPHRASNIALFSLIARDIGLATLKEDVVSEVEQICAQRPINVNRVLKMIAMAERIPAEDVPDRYDQKLALFREAVRGPTELSRDADPAGYRELIAQQDEATLTREARAFAASMNTTGLVCPEHAVLLRALRKKYPELLGEALGVNATGRAALDENRELVHRLLRVAILPATAQAIYGLGRALERGVFSRSAVVTGLERIIELDLRADVRDALLARHTHEGVTANSVLLAGALSVLGQPLGIGQGNNPTCQGARGLSMWAEHHPGYLLEILLTAARDGLVEMQFEGEWLRTNEFQGGLLTTIDDDLDPVSRVLVPHLDRLYDAMMKRVILRQEDGHKWVNPALYGRQVPSGFASVFLDLAQTTVGRYEAFVRRFYATHHPDYTDGHAMMRPNPVGLLITTSHGDYLGPHAVTLLRVAEDPEGVLRAYFFNPNNEGRQDWGDGIKPSIAGHGEIEGESSLPFEHFVARLYAFHYNPYEEGDAYAVARETIDAITALAKKSWGRAFRWVD